MKRTLRTLAVILFLLVLGNAGYAYLNNSSQTTRIQVNTFYDGKKGYSIHIPTGNTSTCTWNYVDGDAALAYTQTTDAQTPTNEHTIFVNDHSDWIVTCVDDLGNHYTGIFPNN